MNTNKKNNKSIKNIKSIKNNVTKNKTKNKKKNKTKRNNKIQIGGLGSFFQAPPKNKEEKLKILTSDIGRVKLQRVETSLKQEFDELRSLKNFCLAGCNIESCMYNNKENCQYLAELEKNKSENIELYCSKKFKSLHCKNYISRLEKIKFYLNYINNVNQKCQKLFNDYNNESNQQRPIK